MEPFLIAALMATSLALMYVSGRMHGREEKVAWRMEELTLALEQGRRNGLAYCKSEYHGIIERNAREAVEREANYARVEYLRESGVREADARADGVASGLAQCEELVAKARERGVMDGIGHCQATHQRRDGKGHFLGKGERR